MQSIEGATTQGEQLSQIRLIERVAAVTGIVASVVLLTLVVIAAAGH